MKTCAKCGLPKEPDQFSKGRGRDGLQHHCKSCNATYYQENKAKIATKRAVYYQANRAGITTKRTTHRKGHRAEIAAYKAAYARGHRAEWRAKEAVHKRERRLVDLNFKLTHNLRGRLYKAVKNGQKSGSAVRDLGCTVPELRTHLESHFYPHPITGEAMTWDNWSPTGWHIDHKKPLVLLIKDPTNRELFLELNHFSNLQPLWAEHNLAKGDGLEWKRAA